MNTQTSKNIIKKYPKLKNIISKIDQILNRKTSGIINPDVLASILEENIHDVKLILIEYENLKLIKSENYIQCHNENCNQLNSTNSKKCSFCNHKLSYNIKNIYKIQT